MRRILLSLILALSMLNINAQTEYGFKAVEVLDSFEMPLFLLQVIRIAIML